MNGQYDDDSFNCQRCGACCGPHYVSPKEEEQIDRYVEERNIGKRSFKSLFDKCPYFEDHSCLIYPVRPLICRLMGLTDLMPCPRGCKPSQIISTEEASQVLLRNTFLETLQ